MDIKWEGLCEETQAVQGLDDITRLDLGPFCRKMEPSQEAYYRSVIIRRGHQIDPSFLYDMLRYCCCSCMLSDAVVQQGPWGMAAVPCQIVLADAWQHGSHHAFCYAAMGCHRRLALYRSFGDVTRLCDVQVEA